MTGQLAIAIEARRRARKTHGVFAYAVWRWVTACERELTDDDFDAYQQWARGEDETATAIDAARKGTGDE